MEQKYGKYQKTLFKFLGYKTYIPIGRPRSGSFNTVQKYMQTFIKNGIEKDIKFAVRISKNSDFTKKNGQIIPTDSFNITMSKSKPIKEFKEDVEKSKDNWIKAAKAKLSPELYYYGYINIKKGGSNNLHLCTISEGFDMDLAHFYDVMFKNNAQNDETDQHIQEQLTDLLNRTAKDLKLICFDIKPSNCVINSETADVKLIDWDADWCIYNSFLKKRDSVANLSGQTGLLMNIVMANFFFKWYNHNIFADYLQKEMKKNKLPYPFTDAAAISSPYYMSLITLFCEPDEALYYDAAEHYFKIKVDNCDDLFKELYKRALSKNKEEYKKDYDNPVPKRSRLSKLATKVASLFTSSTGKGSNRRRKHKRSKHKRSKYKRSKHKRSKHKRSKHKRSKYKRSNPKRKRKLRKTRRRRKYN